MTTPDPALDPLASDPTRRSRWRPLFLLLKRFDAEIEQVYVESGYSDFRARFTLPLVRLAHLGPMTIKSLAAACEVSHSAMSQTVAAMRRAGLVDSAPDPVDGRARRVVLTSKAAGVVKLGEQEWAATEAVVEELEAELPYPLSQVVSDIENALSARDFPARLRAHLAASATRSKA